MNNPTAPMSAFGRAQCEHRRLLLQVKSTVAQLFQQAAVVRTAAEAAAVVDEEGCCYAVDCEDGAAAADVSGTTAVVPILRTAADVVRLHAAVEAIFVHGLRVHGPDGTPDCWPFIEALNWLNPSMCQYLTNTTTALAPTSPPPPSSPASGGISPTPPILVCPSARVRSDRALRWLYDNLAGHQLLAKLQYLVSDAEHLNQCYEVWAYMQSARAVGALMQCLRAVEQAQSNLLAQLEGPQCGADQTDGGSASKQPHTEQQPMHTRSTSHPDFSFVPPPPPPKPAATAAQKRICSLRKSASIRETLRRRQSMQPAVVLQQRSHSLPNVHVDVRPARCCSLPVERPTVAAAAIATDPASKTVPTFTYIPPAPASPRPPTTPNSSASVDHQQQQLLQQLQPIALVRCDDIKIHFDRQHTARVSAGGTTGCRQPPTRSETASSAAIPIHRPPNPPPPQSLLYSLLPMLGKSPTAGDEDGGDGEVGSVSPSLYAQLLAASAPADIVNAFIPQEGEKPYDRRALSSLSPQPGRAGAGTDGGGQQRSNSARHQCELVCNDSDEIGEAAAESGPLGPEFRADTSLKQFLRWAKFSSASSDLERENAHFSVCEAMISAIEQIKCRKLVAHAQPQQQQQKRQSDVELKSYRWPETHSGGSVGRTTTVGLTAVRDTNDKYRRSVMSGSSASSSDASSFGSPIGSTMPVALRLRPAHTANSSSVSSSEPYSSSPDERRTAERPSNPSKHPPASTVSTSKQSLTSSLPPPSPADAAAAASDDATADECRAYAEWGATQADIWSAESVALSLIAKFSDQQLPRAQNLLWLVSEQDAPQKLLPLPGSWTINPDEPYKIPFTRGTRDWAPPRAQVIFTLHEKMSRKDLLLRQNQRCAGCGMRVAAAYSHRFRYCEYLGRYHCTNCHRNQIASIPAHVLHAWDFSVRPVSVFAYRLLEQIATVPVFRMRRLAVELQGGRVRALQAARERRAQLRFVRDFVVACRFAEEDGTKHVFTQVAAHICDDPDAWSMSDFQAVRAGTFVRDIAAVLALCERHVAACQLCQARGFVCELCPQKMVIFPWQANVQRCNDCGVCVHAACAREPCGRCMRLLLHAIAADGAPAETV